MPPSGQGWSGVGQAPSGDSRFFEVPIALEVLQQRPPQLELGSPHLNTAQPQRARGCFLGQSVDEAGLVAATGKGWAISS